MSSENTEKKQYGMWTLVGLSVLLFPFVVVLVCLLVLIAPFVAMYLSVSKICQMYYEIKEKRLKTTIKIKTDINRIRLELEKEKLKYK